MDRNYLPGCLPQNIRSCHPFTHHCHCLTQKHFTIVHSFTFFAWAVPTSRVPLFLCLEYSLQENTKWHLIVSSPIKPWMKFPCLLPRFTNQTSIKGTPYHRHVSSQHFSTETAHSHICLPTLDCELLRAGVQSHLLSPGLWPGPHWVHALPN